MTESLFRVLLPIVMMLALTAGIVMILLGLSVPPDVNVCECGYSRTGLSAGAMCPECGSSSEGRNKPNYVVWKLVMGVCLVGCSCIASALLLAGLMQVSG